MTTTIKLEIKEGELEISEARKVSEWIETHRTADIQQGIYDTIVSRSANELITKSKKGKSIICYEGGDLIGHLNILPIIKQELYGIFSIVTDPSYTGKGIAKKIIQETLLRYGDKNIYLRTHNKKIINIFKQYNFEAFTRDDLLSKCTKHKDLLNIVEDVSGITASNKVIMKNFTL